MKYNSRAEIQLIFRDDGEEPQRETFQFTGINNRMKPMQDFSKMKIEIFFPFLPCGKCQFLKKTLLSAL